MRGLVICLTAVLLAGCRTPPSASRETVQPAINPSPNSAAPSKTTDPLILALRDQLTWGTTYDGAYLSIPYPGGDVPRTQGVCTDVVVRAYRAIDRDLQNLVHEDAKAHPSAYPRIDRLDPNIDHRRCPNLMVYFRRHGQILPIDAQWQPGDLVFWKLDSGLDHVGMLTDQKGPSGQFMVIHNISQPAEEDVLNRWKIVGHYRWR